MARDCRGHNRKAGLGVRQRETTNCDSDPSLFAVAPEISLAREGYGEHAGQVPFPKDPRRRHRRTWHVRTSRNYLLLPELLGAERVLRPGPSGANRADVCERLTRRPETIGHGDRQGLIRLAGVIQRFARERR